MDPQHLLRLFVRLLDRLGRAALAFLFLLSMFELVARAAFGASLGVGIEYGGYLLIAALLLPSGETLLAGRHIRLTLITERLPATDGEALTLAADIIGLFLSLLLAFALGGEALASFLGNARSYFPSATPLYLPQVVATLGALGLAAAFVLRLVAPDDNGEPAEEETRR